MYPPSFDYYRASSVSEALSLLADHPDATVLAGGHALIPHLKNGRADPGAVVDVSDVAALSGLEDDGEATAVGAATTYAALLEAVDELSLEDRMPAFVGATRAVGDRQIRNRGTVGGNLAEAHPDSDLPAAAIVADATVQIRGPDGTREVDAADFVTGPFESAVGDEEIVTTVRIPHVDGGDVGGAYLRKTHPTSGYAMVGVATRVAVADGTISSARIATNGVTDVPVALSSVEPVLEGFDLESSDADERLTEAVADAADDLPVGERRGDVHASADYRTSVLPTYVEQAVRAAIADAGGELEVSQDE
ncbi:FAD binding domain-containing protein [Natronobacterium texcoconense]|uniref:Carbon-monoxide dehydrogenase medium subunit n=1 Tax=Natronobacterium texcoconense TaxID=1095778 RepID=A0A1H1G2Q5_NATTX|nr:FAD binding domain-containing protein [Natronobacterium texcoconense]SDR07497.1 carbon-monoxide dehydrogenase medium subunit [Natronobacterium texcoconense]